LSYRSPAALAAAIAALTIPAGASAATKTVTAGPPPTNTPPGLKHVDADATQFFGETTTIHAGDTIRWKLFGFHSIYFPAKGGKNAPDVVLDPSRQYPAELDPAGQAFWFSGQTQRIANPVAAFPIGGRVEDGSRANGSGAPTGDPSKFRYELRFPKVGTYTYFCTIHPLMKARIKVLPTSAQVPSAATDKKAVDKQVARTIAELKRNLRRKEAAGNVVEAGRDTRDTELLGFYPAKKTVPVGTTVEFRMSPVTSELHTVTFGSDAVLAKGGYAEQLAQALFSPLPGTGQSGPPVLGIPGAAVFPSEPGPLTFDGTQHGGFLNLGLLRGYTGLPRAAKVTFTTPGAYNYECLLHTFMKGQIVVV
jgi:plastocyanin